MISIAFLFISCVKLLLIPSYHSTDFEVHRNWLAITHNLPISKWYFEDSSEWTLDYPPFFAWFEYFLSHFAKWFDINMLKLDNHNYSSFNTILFQRLSVIVTDVVFAYGTYQCTLAFNSSWRAKVVLPLLLLANVGLLMVDHIHFQYNGIMYGILLMSLANMFKERYLSAACWFTVLLNMKHLYLYVAPAYFVYLLRNYCFTSKMFIFNLKHIIQSFSVKNTFRLGAVVISIFAISFVPFLHQIQQVISRLFPFKRGLCHAYWAPNIWAIYNVVDKAAIVAGKTIGLNINNTLATMTGGLVQEVSHTVLPDIKPFLTIVLTATAMLPALYKLWSSGSNALNFVRCLVICGLTSFLFGWHVHEKAILMTIIPLSILSVVEAGDAKTFLLLSTVGHYSLFPLLFPNSLLLIKVTLYVLYSCYAFYSLFKMYPLHLCKYSLPLLNSLESLYLIGLIPLFLYENIFHHMFSLSASLPFLPLMLTSVYCSFGVTYSWLKYYIYFLNKCDMPVKTVKKKR
ncbi:hypothetical protein ILUMI_26349 [Ignelater luminosus]|uniref:Alpha-1,3-glucosyltransferase n=1 Tax=Ignelater luminosus TaxID=2038154 RepID=A0A8K0FXE9_IGNLU|nr:hypothetical protein ILUMI_26349 [Ignelater luminosus]